MRAQGLTTGCWVRIPSGQTGRVRTLNADGTVGVGIGADLMGFDARVLSPVALTPELLLGNGFEKGMDDVHYTDGETRVQFYGPAMAYCRVEFENLSDMETRAETRSEVHRLQVLWAQGEVEREFRL